MNAALNLYPYSLIFSLDSPDRYGNRLKLLSNLCSAGIMTEIKILSRTNGLGPI